MKAPSTEASNMESANTGIVMGPIIPETGLTTNEKAWAL